MFDGFITVLFGILNSETDERKIVLNWSVNGTDGTNGTDGADGSIPLVIPGLTLSSGSWSLVSGFYEYDLANASITATSEVEVIFMKSTIDIVKTADVMPDNLADTGTVKIYATNEPTADIDVTIIITEVTV